MFSEKDLLFLVPEPLPGATAEGGFARRVLIISSLGDAGARAFLEKVLGAVQLNLAQDTLFVALQSGGQVALTPLLREKQPTQVLVFGLKPDDLGLHVQPVLYQPVNFLQTNLLFADDLATLEPDRDRKTRLWAALKTLFQSG